MRSVYKHGSRGAWASVAVAWGSAALVATANRDARAEGAAEPSYGRIDGDVNLVVGAGASVASAGARAAVEVRARYLETAGLFATYEDALGRSSVAPGRVLAFGLELRPLFLYRWLEGHETQHARWDLMLDSLGLELGMVWPQDLADAAFASHPGIEAGLGFEWPVTPDASGPWVDFHGGLRWNDDALAAGPVKAGDRQAYLAITLAWHQVVSTHLVDLDDRAPR